MNGVIVNFRRGRHVQYTNQAIIQIDSVKSKEDAEKMLNKKVIWTTASKKEIIGKTTKAHGNNGAILARFDRGLPGQSLGTRVKVE